VLRAVAARAGDQETKVGALGPGGPDLLTVDDEVVTVFNRAGAWRRQVRPGVGLAEELAPELDAAEDRLQIPVLLALVPPGKIVGPAQPIPMGLLRKSHS
jgi:hypothetical protein